MTCISSNNQNNLLLRSISKQHSVTAAGGDPYSSINIDNNYKHPLSYKNAAMQTCLGAWLGIAIVSSLAFLFSTIYFCFLNPRTYTGNFKFCTVYVPQTWIPSGNPKFEGILAFVINGIVKAFGAKENEQMQATDAKR
eukprot:Pgem_evm1s6778